MHAGAVDVSAEMSAKELPEFTVNTAMTRCCSAMNRMPVMHDAGTGVAGAERVPPWEWRTAEHDGQGRSQPTGHDRSDVR